MKVGKKGGQQHNKGRLMWPDDALPLSLRVRSRSSCREQQQRIKQQQTEESKEVSW
jgi:hypothetical protein